MKNKAAFLGMFTAIAIIFGYVESLIPVVAGNPGIKLGLANLCVLFLLDRFSIREAALVSAARILVLGYLFGNLFGILYSLAGAALSLTVMALLLRYGRFSLIGVSVAGGISHNIGQLVVAALVIGSSILYYFPVLMVSGVLAGIAIGWLTQEVSRRVHFRPDTDD